MVAACVQDSLDRSLSHSRTAVGQERWRMRVVEGGTWRR